MTLRVLAALLAITLAGPLGAQSVDPCDWRAEASNLMEPWEENTRTFAGGRIRIAALDTIEPALGAFHLLVISPPFDVLGARQCRVVSLDGGIGFAGLSFDRITATYDPQTGLGLAVPIKLPAPDGSLADAQINVSINQATGDVLADMKPGAE